MLDRSLFDLFVCYQQQLGTMAEEGRDALEHIYMYVSQNGFLPKY